MKVMRVSEVATDRFEVGDRIAVKLPERTYTATAIQDEGDGMLFLFDQYLDKAMPMNRNGSADGGYEKSDLRKHLQTMTEAFPDELKERMLPFANGDFLRLLTLQEMCGKDENFKECEGQIEWMEDRRHRIASRRGMEYEWGWLATVVESTHSALVSDGGGATSYCASDSYGVRPAFQLSQGKNGGRAEDTLRDNLGETTGHAGDSLKGMAGQNGLKSKDEKELDTIKYWVCCPMCDNEKCMKGTEKCEAEQWVKKKKSKFLLFKDESSAYEKGIAEIMEHCQRTLIEKHREYATDGDDYHNFNEAASITDQTPEQVLWGYALKHVISISDMIFRQAKQPDKFFSLGQWREKCGDLINYMAILYAMEREYDFARQVMYRSPQNESEEDCEDGDAI